MRAVFFKKIRKATLLILFFSITAIMLTSFFPIVKQKVSNESNQHIYYSKETLNKNDSDLSNINGMLNIISSLLWLIIVIEILTFLGLIITISKKNKSSSYLFLIISIIVFILSLSIIIQGYLIGNKISITNNISLAYIFDPFAYFYITFIFYFLTLIGSIFFVTGVSIYIFKTVKTKELKEEISNDKDKKLNKDRIFKTKRKILKDNKYDSKKEEKVGLIGEAEVWDFSEDEIKKPQQNEDLNDISYVKNDLEKIEKTEKNLLETENIKLEKIKDDEKKDRIFNNDNSPFKESNPKEKKLLKQQESIINNSEKTESSSNFEKALSSAIEKKHDIVKKNNEDFQHRKPEISSTFEEKAIIKDKELLDNDIVIENKSPFKDNKKEDIQTEKEFKVRCPICSNIFPVNQGDKKIKCPFCNAEGVIE